ncbi:hypothetical protein BUALT_Bualt18G0000700 [Buddleja alternifolia]|uniref:FAS1 domain-containing protein n=1 Tax=Buddleja alternifolia TaxID=168488 RepID=A0AAV6WBY0_9LAMI|nr:hypothetical protein BUALT_Bualt18G0000700 [Buddleja alternifolia]
MMKNCLLVSSAMIILFCFASPSNAQKSVPVPVAAPMLAPAPAPAPDYVNLTELLSVAGPFHTFLQLLQSTKVIDTFQNQANNTEEGITLFVPKDEAFSSLKNKPSLSNLTQDQLKSLCLFHALPHYYSLADFRNLSEQNPIPTFAGGQYALNFTDNSGTVRLDSGWTITKVISAVHSTDPVALYETDRDFELEPSGDCNCWGVIVVGVEVGWLVLLLSSC